MRFITTRLQGVYIIEPEPLQDDRGLFARVWCRQELEAHQLDTRLAQCSISLNKRKGTLRGLHYQDEPYPETKVVRCTAGAIYDVAIDLRYLSSTFRQWVAVELTATNHRMLYIPTGVAHGLLTLEDNTEVFYQISEFYHPECARGVRWNDPAFNIEWPMKPTVISPRDQLYPDFDQ
jgi:dTDP-4-dehydrorhamnose 3,5-epimerase